MQLDDTDRRLLRHVLAEPELTATGEEELDEELPRMTLLDHLDELRRRRREAVIEEASEGDEDLGLLDKLPDDAKA